MRGTVDGWTDGWTGERMDGRTDERALRRDQIRNGRWSIERLASIHSPPNSLDLAISPSLFLSPPLSPLNFRFFSLLRLIASILLRHVFRLPYAFSNLLAFISFSF